MRRLLGIRGIAVVLLTITAACSRCHEGEVCCKDGSECDCWTPTCAEGIDGFCSCAPEGIFDFEREDTRVDVCAPEPEGQCCVHLEVGICFCHNTRYDTPTGCEDGDVPVEACTPDEVRCSNYESEVNRCSRR